LNNGMWHPCQVTQRCIHCCKTNLRFAVYTLPHCKPFLYVWMMWC
jgi:hypothetical protein